MTQWSQGEGNADGQDARLFDFLADLEARAGALHDRERRAEVEDRARSAYAEVELAGRLMASLGRELAVEVRGLGRVEGTLERVGNGWFRLDAPAGVRDVRLAAVVAVRGASARAVPPQAWSPLDRLQVGSVLRRLADEASRVQLHLVDGSRREGTLGRVGADFVEVLVAPDVVDLVVLDAVSVIASEG